SPNFAEDSAATLSTSGFINFADVDLQDTHAVSASLVSAVVLGGSVPVSTQALLQTALTATLVDPATGDGHGQYQWNFALANSAVQFLSQGQTLTVTYQTTVTDSSPFAGGHASASQPVTVTITGTNDAPVVLNTTASGLLAEDGTTTADGFAL